MTFISLSTNADKMSRVEKKREWDIKSVKIYITINVQLQQLSNRMPIPYFKGIFMCTILLTGGVYRNENGIVNLDNAEELIE